MSKIKSYYFETFEADSALLYSRYSTDSFKGSLAASEPAKQYLGSHASKKQLKRCNSQQEFNFDSKAL